jgi:hypothetical protein
MWMQSQQMSDRDDGNVQKQFGFCQHEVPEVKETQLQLRQVQSQGVPTHDIPQPSRRIAVSGERRP